MLFSCCNTLTLSYCYVILLYVIALSCYSLAVILLRYPIVMLFYCMLLHCHVILLRYPVVVQKETLKTSEQREPVNLSDIIVGKIYRIVLILNKKTKINLPT